MTEAQFNQRLDVAIAKVGSLRAFARKHGMSAAYVSDVTLGKRSAGPKVAKALGFRVVVRRLTIREYHHV